MNSKIIRDTAPPFLNNRKPPMVTYTYTKSISGSIFNHRKIVEELDFDRGIEDMRCECSTSSYCYEPAGHVVTEDLNIIRDSSLRS